MRQCEFLGVRDPMKRFRFQVSSSIRLRRLNYGQSLGYGIGASQKQYPELVGNPITGRSDTYCARPSLACRIGSLDNEQLQRPMTVLCRGYVAIVPVY